MPSQMVSFLESTGAAGLGTTVMITVSEVMPQPVPPFSVATNVKVSVCVSVVL
jgi:hypothetical protein